MMNAYRKLLGVLVGTLLLFAGFGSALAQDKGTVVYLIPTLLDEFQTESQSAIEFVFPQLGYEVLSLDAQNRADLQLNQFDDAIELEPAAIILNAVDFDAAITGIEKARAAGIPVLVYDRLIRSIEVDFTSVSGNVQIGVIAAGEIARLLEERNGSPQGKVLQILGDPGDSYTLDIQQGFEATIAQYPDVELITNAALQWEATNAADIAEQQLLVNPDVDLIFSHAAHLSGAVQAVLEAQGKEPGDIYMVSSNGAPVGLSLIREGWLQAEIEQPLYAQIWGLAAFIDKIVAGEPLEPGTYDVLGLDGVLTMEAWGPNLALPGAAITADNVDDSRFWGNLQTPTSPVVPVE
ncbi:MAG: sugar ABC transporter substrate-binding protein [Trueperaceae bacterium]|nr:MAG: sugar ABC transporter substrate-binding protein [Trueperaceae bacterium]